MSLATAGAASTAAAGCSCLCGVETVIGNPTGRFCHSGALRSARPRNDFDHRSSDSHLCLIQCREAQLLPAVSVKIVRREPGLEGALARGPLAVEHGEPGGVAASALDDHMLAEDALES